MEIMIIAYNYWISHEKGPFIKDFGTFEDFMY